MIDNKENYSLEELFEEIEVLCACFFDDNFVFITGDYKAVFSEDAKKRIHLLSNGIKLFECFSIFEKNRQDFWEEQRLNGNLNVDTVFCKMLVSLFFPSFDFTRYESIITHLPVLDELLNGGGND